MASVKPKESTWTRAVELTDDVMAGDAHTRDGTEKQQQSPHTTANATRTRLRAEHIILQTPSHLGHPEFTSVIV